MTRIVVFTGPSLSADEACLVLEAEYRPPVRRGDVEALLDADPPDAIAIVDGVFFQAMSVSPKELLAALRAGVSVYGSSSMGALRAVELERYGMRGVGAVFELYRSGLVDADDEVAMVFDPVDHAPLSEPLVNIRVALAAAVDARLIDSDDERALLRVAKATYFPHRSYGALVADAAGQVDAGRLERLAAFLEHEAPNAKRDDALAMLETVRTEHTAGDALRHEPAVRVSGSGTDRPRW